MAQPFPPRFRGSRFNPPVPNQAIQYHEAPIPVPQAAAQAEHHEATPSSYESAYCLEAGHYGYSVPLYAPPPHDMYDSRHAYHHAYQGYYAGFPAGIYGTYPVYQPVVPAAVAVVHPPATRFFKRFYDVKWRDIALVIDASSSMLPHWSEVRASVNWIADRACKFDPDGITLYFFNSPGNIRCFQNVRTAAEVNDKFKQVSPQGSTDLAGVLRSVAGEHYDPRRNHKPTTALVVTDGAPDNADAVVLELISMANKVVHGEEELGITFVQMGNDAQATAFLKMLDDDLLSRGARVDIVDTLKSPEMKQQSWLQIVQNSIYD